MKQVNEIIKNKTTLTSNQEECNNITHKKHQLRKTYNHSQNI